MEQLEKMEPVEVKAEASTSPAIELIKSIGSTIIADTPKWAKFVRIGGILMLSIGIGLTALNPALAPAWLVSIAGYSELLKVVGTGAITVVQFTAKTKKE